MLPVNDNHEKPEARLWEALEGRAKEFVCGAFMAMGTVHQGDTEIFLYKSIKTRSYVNLDKDGHSYRHTGSAYQSMAYLDGEKLLLEILQNEYSVSP